MSSTQRSESMNSYFDGFINSKSMLRQFVENYEVALLAKIEKEAMADADCSLKTMHSRTGLRIERQLMEVYTHGIYQMVREEFSKMVYNLHKLKRHSGFTHVYVIDSQVELKKDFWKRVEYDVVFNSNSLNVHCNCFLFESKGILCSHALTILMKHDIDELPPKYILDRWRKDIHRPHTDIKFTSMGPVMSSDMVRLCYLDTIYSIAANSACLDQEKVEFFASEVKKIQEKLQNWDTIDLGGGNCEEFEEVNVQNSSKETLADPTYTRRRGRPRQNRLVSTQEKQKKKEAKGTRKRKNQDVDPKSTTKVRKDTQKKKK